MIHLAYDGSLHADWVSRYAIRLAARAGGDPLRVVHVPDGSVTRETLDAKLDRIQAEAREQGVGVERVIGSRTRGVVAALDALLPRGPDQLVVCGTRVRPRRGFLAGTVSQHLLRQHELRVAAIRVVQPGLLGHPRRFLVPVSGNAAGVAAAWPFFRLFLADAEHLSLLRVMPGGGLGSSAARRGALRSEGWAQLDALASAMRERLGIDCRGPDMHVALSDDWPHEILVQASEVRARMILMGASQRTLFGRALWDPLESILRGTPCDVAVCRSP